MLSAQVALALPQVSHFLSFVSGSTASSTLSSLKSLLLACSISPLNLWVSCETSRGSQIKV